MIILFKIEEIVIYDSASYQKSTKHFVVALVSG